MDGLTDWLLVTQQQRPVNRSHIQRKKYMYRSRDPNQQLTIFYFKCKYAVACYTCTVSKDKMCMSVVLIIITWNLTCLLSRWIRCSASFEQPLPTVKTFYFYSITSVFSFSVIIPFTRPWDVCGVCVCVCWKQLAQTIYIYIYFLACENVFCKWLRAWICLLYKFYIIITSLFFKLMFCTFQVALKTHLY